jgi:hypothetical protein
MASGVLALPGYSLEAGLTVSPKASASQVGFSQGATGRAIGLTRIWGGKCGAGSRFADGDSHPTPRFPDLLRSRSNSGPGVVTSVEPEVDSENSCADSGIRNYTESPAFPKM